MTIKNDRSSVKQEGYKLMDWRVLAVEKDSA